jgi:uncharacterized LabA/DUF88 family protein
MIPRRIAILIDGGFFLKRLPHLVGSARCATAERITGCIRHMCHNHVKALTGCDSKEWNRYVYRIFYYDAAPYDGKAHHPIDNRSIDFAKSKVAAQRLALFDCLRRQRKVALRLGKVNREHDWVFRPDLTKKLLRTRSAVDILARLTATTAPGDASASVAVSLSGPERQCLLDLQTTWRSLDSSAVSLGLRQKGVDMRIGIDIASLALKKQADTIVLISGDSDFVPAAKLARREGVDFVLDPLWQHVNADLFEHIDGLQSGLSRPGQPQKPEYRASESAVAGGSHEESHATQV